MDRRDPFHRRPPFRQLSHRRRQFSVHIVTIAPASVKAGQPGKTTVRQGCRRARSGPADPGRPGLLAPSPPPIWHTADRGDRRTMARLGSGARCWRQGRGPRPNAGLVLVAGHHVTGRSAPPSPEKSARTVDIHTRRSARAAGSIETTSCDWPRSGPVPVGGDRCVPKVRVPIVCRCPEQGHCSPRRAVVSPGHSVCSRRYIEFMSMKYPLWAAGSA